MSNSTEKVQGVLTHPLTLGVAAGVLAIASVIVGAVLTNHQASKQGELQRKQALQDRLLTSLHAYVSVSLEGSDSILPQLLTLHDNAKGQSQLAVTKAATVVQYVRQYATLRAQFISWTGRMDTERQFIGLLIGIKDDDTSPGVTVPGEILDSSDFSTEAHRHQAFALTAQNTQVIINDSVWFAKRSLDYRKMIGNKVTPEWASAILSGNR